MWPVSDRKQAGGYVFDGLTATPFGVGLIAVAFLMVMWPGQSDLLLFRLGAALVLGGAVAAGRTIRRHYAEGDRGGGDGASTATTMHKITAGALLVASGLVGNHLGFPLFELTAGFWLVWVGRRHAVHVLLGSLYIVLSPFVWSRVAPSMVGAVSFAMLGAICVIGSMYEHRMIRCGV